ncbi:MucR family transcriptional regulator [Mesorhizobium neociceri]|uniref:MucR family transcriptional regulator n=1 Tax=Mesorhizobium neociceri TaxID=1307853 RepID=A0A838B1S4_9HYPH|nr:MucR family transcriptional regulator [Mesorhizobium neociceri]MBA1139957.1 MucR family transcriptional regulator [Mesorhizobium neociceri]
MAQKNDLDPIVSVTAGVVSAYISNNSLPAADLPGFIGQVYSSLKHLADGSPAARANELKAAVPVKKSITPDFIFCLEDGKPFKSLKRHLSVHYGLTPDQYRMKWSLPPDYPMTAPNYSTRRSTLAKSMGLGQKPR